MENCKTSTLDFIKRAGKYTGLFASVFIYSSTISVADSEIEQYSCPRKQEPNAVQNLSCQYEALLMSNNFKIFLEKNKNGLKTFQKAIKNISHLGAREKSHLLSNLAQISAEDFEKYILEPDTFAEKISQSAYQSNILRSISKAVMKHRVPIVYREPTFASQSLQQNGLSTKPQSIKNKSSIIPNISGLIPCNGFAGKTGTQLRTFEKKCGAKLECLNDQSSQKKYDQLKTQVNHENEMIEQQLNSGQYQKIPVTREKNGITEVVVYTDDRAEATQWVPMTERMPKNTAYVLADSKNNAITADTDLFMVGLPKGKKHKIIFDTEVGYRSTLTDQVRNDINKNWQALTGNDNIIIQHGDESVFGLNAINDVLVAVGINGKVQRFDLTLSQPNRENELQRYTQWLKEQSHYSDIPVPTQALQEARAQAFRERFNSEINYQDALRDYAKIRAILKDKAYSPPIEIE